MPSGGLAWAAPPKNPARSGTRGARKPYVEKHWIFCPGGPAFHYGPFFDGRPLPFIFWARSGTKAKKNKRLD